MSVTRFEYLKEFELYNLEDDVRIFLRPIFDRAGYLSYSADIISNSKEYDKVINSEYYFMSLIDNVFTPGFNVFGTPKASNALRYIYLDIKPNPTHKDVVANYNSDMFTIYGEYYILFGGYPALIFLFLSSYFFKRLYLAVRTRNVFSYYLYRSLILLVFYRWLLSFGMDWIVVDIISLLIPIFIWRRFYFMRKRKLISSQPAVDFKVL